MSTTIHPPSTLISRLRIRDDVLWMPVLWLAFVVAVAAVVAVLSAWGPKSTSIWESASQLPRWFAGAVGVYLMAVYLPVYIAHGFSRREYMGQVPIHGVAMVTFLSILVTLGFPLERVIYHALGWTQALGSNHLFGSATEYSLIFVEMWLINAVWFTGGMLVGAAFYRSGWLGALSIPYGLLVLAVVSMTVRRDPIGIPPVHPSLSDPVVHAAIVCGAIVLVSSVGTWLLVRDMPVRAKSG